MSKASTPAPSALWQDIQAPRWQPNRTAWLLTCVDLTSLLVGFFVLLFSTQTLKREQWEAMTGSLQDRFAERPAVVTSLPDGMDNAVIRVTGVKSGLGYLDALLHQRLQNDPDWGRLLMVSNGQDIAYRIPEALRVTSGESQAQAWKRLADVVRGWKNSVGVRVTAAPQDAGKAAEKALELADMLAKNGVSGTFADVMIQDGTRGGVELVVRAQ